MFKTLDVKKYPGFGWITGFFFLFMYLPIIVVIAYSFNENKIVSIWSGFSFKWYESAIHNQGLIQATKVSISVALIAMTLSTLIALAAAMVLVRGKSVKYRELSETFINLPLMLPEIVFSVAILILFSQMGLQHGMTKLVLAHTAFCIPFAFLPIRARLQGMDSNIEAAASDLYAGPWTTFRLITLPMILPGVFAGAVLAFIISMDDFITSNMLGGGGATTLPVYIFSLVRQGVSPEINAISTLIIGISLLIGVPYWIVSNRKKEAD
jgi:spermidine/putrescine transport system permease protein